ncbi:MAG: hypothetical protein ACLFV6_02495 [Spirulinaceae cyanobacterium]
MSDKNPRFDVKTSSRYTLGGLGWKTHKTTIRDNSTGKTYTGTSDTSPSKSRDNAFKNVEE